MKLAATHLHELVLPVPGYGRSRISTGIVHFGPTDEYLCDPTPAVVERYRRLSDLTE
ncbi:hypothetical protein [Mycobacterium asiaticum]|uniref:hypothetical protein n=1 Tax=Mycobacterium asiaticum TaxID=1790 RepID=UPI0012DB4566|nr:hypothetical protein [Mycobacterium asiaticum]